MLGVHGTLLAKEPLRRGSPEKGPDLLPSKRNSSLPASIESFYLSFLHTGRCMGLAALSRMTVTVVFFAFVCCALPVEHPPVCPFTWNDAWKPLKRLTSKTSCIWKLHVYRCALHMKPHTEPERVRHMLGSLANARVAGKRPCGHTREYDKNVPAFN